MPNKLIAEPDLVTADRVELVHPAITVNRTLFLGAAWGVVAWSAYALVEFTLCAIWPLFTTRQAVFTPLSWRLTAWLFNSYWILGGAAGALVALLAARRSGAPVSAAGRRDQCRLAGALSLYAAMLLHLLTGPGLHRNITNVMIMTLFLASIALWVLFHPNSRLAPFAFLNPLLAALLLIGPNWFSIEVFGEWGSPARRGAALLMVLAGLGMSRLLHRFPTWSASRHLAGNLALLALVTVASAGLSGRNRELPPSPSLAASDPGTPPVILVSLDTTRADHMSVYGYPRKTTPHLEEFARGATRYTDLVAASDMTLSSHGSMFSGLYPSWHGAHYTFGPEMVSPLHPQIPTLAGTLAEHGVFTAAVAANDSFLTPEWGLARGFESFDVQTPVAVLRLVQPQYLRQGIRRLLSCCFDTLDFDQQYRRAGDITNDAIGILEDSKVRTRSFFLFVNYMDAHAPYIAHVAADSPLPAERGGPDLAGYYALSYSVIRTGKPPLPDVRDRLIERYDAGIAAEDAGFQELVEWLKRRELYDRSMIIVTADHGEAFGEHGAMEHGVGAYQDQVHVPLIIKYPHQSTAAIVTDPVSHVDLLPTVLETLGLPAAAPVQGRSLRDSAGLAGRPVYTESFPPRWSPENFSSLNRIERGMRSGAWKLIVSTRGKHELFDIPRDPAELHNLTATAPPEAPGLDTALRSWIQTAPATESNSVRNEEQLKRLRGLGYVR